MIWFRQACDTEEAWAAFQAYRDQKPPRRLIRPGPNPTSDLAKWYRDNNWKERCIAYDVHLDSIVQEERDELLRNDTREVTAQHRAILQDARRVAELEVSKLLAAANASPNAPGLRPTELIKMIDSVVKLDRLLRDQSTENTTVKPDLSGLPVDDLLKLAEIRKKLEK